MRNLRQIAAVVLALACGAAAQARKPAGALVEARAALFERNELEGARQAAQAVLQRNPANAEALFIEMEAAAMQADTAAELEAALRLVEHDGADRRAAIAAARVLDLAANTTEFRAALPRVRKLVSAGSPQNNYLRAALVAAASDGAPGIPMLQVAREAGLLTDWRVAGPFGHLSNLDFDRVWPPEQDGLALPVVGGRAVETLRVEDGTFSLPDYFARAGLYYAVAMAKLSTPGNWYLRVESPGTVQVFVDGVAAVRKDDRFRDGAEIAWRRLRLGAGAHRVLVKFLAGAAPFRIALVPAQAAPRPDRGTAYAPEAAYLAAAEKFWNGDYQGALDKLRTLPQAPAVANFLAAKAWAHLADGSSEEADLLRSTLQAAPTAAAARFDVGERAWDSQRSDQALAAVRSVLSERPRFARAQRLMAQIAIRERWPEDASKALDAELELHPSCEALNDAADYFAAQEQFARAQQVEKQLEDCAPDSQSYIEALAKHGDHAGAARAAARLVAAHPLSRRSREALVRELQLSGNQLPAIVAARQLAEIAPNSARYARAAENPATLFDDSGQPATAFYQPWRRDGVAMVALTRERQFSGGPAVVLLDDQVAQLSADGSVSVYTHRITRVLNRDGIERYGEVQEPAGAEVLELRTIKPDGQIAEPELTGHKSTVSMPALAAGDAIDEEYVVRYADGGAEAHADAFTHTFGSFRAPIVFSRFVVLSPAGLEVDSHGAAPQPSDENMHGFRAQTWEKNDIPQSAEEVALPRRDVLPTARALPRLPRGWAEVRDQVRDSMVDALHIGGRVQHAADRALAELDASATAQAKARTLYRWVMSNIRSGDDDFSLLIPASAEDTLAAGAGNRSVVLLALARAAGLNADLLLTRNPGTSQPEIASLDAYTRPVILFQFPGSNVAVDAETDGLAFGALSPGVERNDALLVPLASEQESAEQSAELRGPAIVAFPGVPTPEQSVASADVRIADNGDLEADVRIVLGSWRGSQMRSILAGIEPAGRAAFFQQLASRLFPGVSESSGEVKSEHDSDQPLEILLHCRAPQFVKFTPGARPGEPTTAELDQLVPTLGLKKMYGPMNARRFPVFVDTPLVETATFRVHLPAGVEVLHMAPDAKLRSPFGEYSLAFLQLNTGEVEIRREFRIPVQVVAEDKIDDFSAFAGRIDNAERQRLTIGTDSPATTAAARVYSSQPQ